VLKQRVELTKSVSSISFGNDRLNFQIFQQGVQWMGKCFYFSSKKRQISRFYSICLCMQSSVADKYNDLAKAILNDTDYCHSPLDSFTTTQTELEFFIKQYPVKKFSEYVHQCGIKGEDNHFTIQGPLGFGLDLSPSSSGVHVAFYAGTGVFSIP